MRVLERRLNKIQEENNKSADEEEGEVEDEAGELSDDPSTLPEEEDDEDRKEKKDLETEEKDQVPKTLLQIYDPKRFATDLFKRDDKDETMSSKSCDIARHHKINSSNVNNSCFVYSAKTRRPLHRAHSCGSLMSLKERALLSKRLPQALLWDIFNEGSGGDNDPDDEAAAEAAKDLALTIVSNPLAVLRWQGASKCCNLC